MDTNRLTVNPKRMRTTRRLLGMSQEGLSAATEGRVSRYAIRELEAGRAVQDDGAVAYSLSAALRVPYRFLMGSSYYDDYRETPSWRAVKKIPGYVAERLREQLVYFVDMYRDLEEYVEDRDVFRSDRSRPCGNGVAGIRRGRRCPLMLLRNMPGCCGSIFARAKKAVLPVWSALRR